MPEGNKSIRRFGTLEGVFLPTILSLFGVILFLRTGWVVGNSGLYNALLILLLSGSISFFTALSISSISTNIEVGTGGVYYLISRSLGIDAGGAIGIPLYLSQAISVAFYIIGFLESLKVILPSLNFALWGSVLLLLFAILAFYGADFAVKFQFVIFAFLMLGVLSVAFASGFIPLKDNLTPHYAEGYDFFRVFAVFFPAVTGITAGIGLSGELKNPAKSIPIGSISALLVALLTYAYFMTKAAAIAPHGQLIENTEIFIKHSVFSPLVLLGIWAATLSSGLTFVITAPRTLKALSDDRITPRFTGLTLGSPKNEPRMGVIITFVISEAFVLMGSLNAVATVISMFFLITYGMINFACLMEIVAGNPSFRPRFRVPFYVPLLGFLGTLGVMFLISPLSTIISLVVVGGIYAVLKNRSLKQDWGDVKAGVLMTLARFSLLKLSEFELDPKNYRPNLMVFTGNPQTRPHLARLASWLARGNGIITFINILKGNPENDEDIEKRKKAFQALKDFVEENKFTAFYEVELVENPIKSIECVVQAHGIGNLYSNVALFGWGHQKDRENILLKHIRKLVNLQRDILILDYKKDRGFGNFNRIDVWWGGKGGNIELMLLLAYILKLNDEWRDTEVRVLKVVSKRARKNIAEQNIKDRLDAARLTADVKVIVNEKMAKPVKEVIYEHSKDTSLVILGLPVPAIGEEQFVAERINELIKDLPTTLLVRSVFKKGVFEE